MLKLSPLRKFLNGDDKCEAIGEIFIWNLSCKKESFRDKTLTFFILHPSISTLEFLILSPLAIAIINAIAEKLQLISVYFETFYDTGKSWSNRLQVANFWY